LKGGYDVKILISKNKLMKKLKGEDGLGTVEIVVIIAVLVGIALIFRDAIIKFAVNLMKSIFGDNTIINDIKSSGIRNSNVIN
jgi:hypothetical protein